MKALLAYAVAIGVLLAAPAMAQWNEQGDAGDLPATAQIPIGSGALTTISGSATSGGDVDMYCIGVTDPAAFTANTCGASAAWDTQLFLFRADGVGVIWDDDTCASGLQSEITGGFANCLYNAGAGNYYIAVSRYNNDPRNGTTVIFGGAQNTCNTGAALVVNNWSGSTSVAGVYTINLTGCTYCSGATAVEPSTWGSIKNFYR